MNADLRSPVEQTVAAALEKHWNDCTHRHPTNESWRACEARMIVEALFEGAAAESLAGVPEDAAEEFARCRADGRDTVESLARALIPGARL